LPSQGVQHVGAHRARPFALRSEHVAVGDQGLLVAEQAGEVRDAVLGHEPVVADHLATRRQGAALGGDARKVAAQLDLLGQQSGPGGAVLGALVWNPQRIVASQLVGRDQGFGLCVHRSFLRDRKLFVSRLAPA